MDGLNVDGEPQPALYLSCIGNWSDRQKFRDYTGTNFITARFNRRNSRKDPVT